MSELSLLHPWLDGQAAVHPLPPAVLNAMHVALEEAVMNVAMHGYSPTETGEIVVGLQVASDAAVVVVEDGGRDFDPVHAPEHQTPSTLLDAEPGGLGLTLLRHFCRDITYRRVDGRNQLTLRFPVAA